MPKRQRWTPVKGETNRVYDPRERLLLGAADALGRGLFALAGLGAQDSAGSQETPRDVLVLRLDRIGDVVMSLPALADLRAALPDARIRLAVGCWSAGVARSAPVDEVLSWSAPWVGRPSEGAETARSLFGKARALARERPDLAIDLQGDVRAACLLWLSGARRRVGYANTGGRYMLSEVVPLDEGVSWVEQNRRAVALALGREPGTKRAEPLGPDDRLFAERLLNDLGLLGCRPLVMIHPSGGRTIKQWPLARWSEVVSRLQRECHASVLISGSEADRSLAGQLASGLSEKPLDLSGRLSVRESLALIERMDLFLSPDTGPMHMACAVGTPSVSVFGPSDPTRYFSGGSGASGTRHVVVRVDLWCAPCNLIRRPPSECARAAPPECLERVPAETVFREAARLLRDVGGFQARAEA